MATTVHDAFREAAARWPDHAFLCTTPDTARHYGVEPGEITYARAQAGIEALRQSYAAAGYGMGHRVGLLLENRPAFLLHWFALNALGVSVVPINAELRLAELDYLIGHSDVALIVALANRHGLLRKAAQAARGESAPAVIAPDEAPPPVSLAAPQAAGSPGPHTECALLYTSGTTGRPKGCMLPNEYFLHAGAWYRDIGGLAGLVPGAERMLTPLPLVHMNAMAYSVMAMVMTGGCLIAIDRFHPSAWWRTVAESEATVVHYLGVMPAILMKAEPSPQDRAHRVRFGFGAGVDRSLHAAFEARFGFPLLEAWAMTETGAGAVVIANEEPRFVGQSCFGREQPDVQLRIVADGGCDAEVDEQGELLVRHGGENPRFGFFAGYLKDDDATRDAWQGGWFHTGDIVRRNAQGYLHFVDRKKNVIRRSGENIAAVEVESVLGRHPAVRQAAVAAVPDLVRGDEVLACIVPHAMPESPEAAAGLARQIVAWSLEQLAYYKVPGHVAFVESLPLTATNKIQRGELKALAATLPGTPMCVDTCVMKKRQELAT